MAWLAGLINNLANDPVQSWKRFKIAVGLFLLAAILIFAGTLFSPLLQIPGLLLLAVALLLAIWGYAGILCHRIVQFKASTNKNTPSQNPDIWK